MARGSVVEKSPDADNYRAEILGGILVQLVLRAASQNKYSPYAPVVVDCDNLGVVRHGNAPKKSLKEKQPQADALRSFKQLITENPLECIFRWVEGHLDDHKTWQELSLREKINVLVDKLAKKALMAAVASEEFISSCFPFEHIRVEVAGVKVTGSPKKAFIKYWGRKTAMKLYHDKKILDKRFFHHVWWDGAGAVMDKFPKMFRLFVTKQTSKFCGTNRQLSRYDPSVKNVCPSCGQRDESSKHITRCQDEGRVEMFRQSAEELLHWIDSTIYNPSFVCMLREYLMAQGRRKLTDCVAGYSPTLQVLARVHDRLGWDNFIEGRICKMYLEVYRTMGLPSVSLSPAQWGRTFVTKLLCITHKQWLFRNSHIYYKKLDGLTAQQHESILARVRELMWTDPSELLSNHQQLLEVDFEELGEGPSSDRQQWIIAMESAISLAGHVRAGRPIRGNIGTFPTRRTANVSQRPSRTGSVVYRSRSRRT
jgi:hypothetical protein